MATIKDYFNSGIANGVNGIMSRLANDYREGYAFGSPENKEVMRETYKFLSVLNLAITDYQQHHGRIANKCLLYDCWLEFKAYMQSDTFKQVVELSACGCYAIITPHMLECLEWFSEFCSELLQDMITPTTE